MIPKAIRDNFFPVAAVAILSAALAGGVLVKIYEWLAHSPQIPAYIVIAHCKAPLDTRRELRAETAAELLRMGHSDIQIAINCGDEPAP